MLRRLFLAGLLALAAAMPAGAASVLPVSLDHLVSNAAVAFEGTVVDNTTQRDPATGFAVTYTTFQVRDVIKGEVPDTYVIKQVGGDLPGEPSFRVQGVPTFSLGEDYVVFMAGVSRSGFSSPIGLAQGRFKVNRGQAQRAEVSNGRDLREMTEDIPDAELPPGLAGRLRGKQPVRALDLQDFKALARQRADRGRR